MDERRAINLRTWDERVPVHETAASYGVDEIATDPDRISYVVEFDRERLGVDVAGKRLLHLQCHIGTDTVSWGKLGAAEVVGYDFSQPALDAAARLAERAGINARWFRGDLYDAPDVIGAERFDVVYTGIGALNWLPEVRPWAEVVAHFLAPGGTFYMREGHPVLWALDYDHPTDLRFDYPYFETAEAMEFDEPGTYAVADAEFEHNRTVEWNHGLGEIVTALLDAGLELRAFEEHRFVDWKPFEQFVCIDEVRGHYALPDDRRDLIPVSYSLRFTRPA